MPDPFPYWPAKGHSQSGEEVIVSEIMRRIGVGTGFFVDVGAGDGIEGSNTRALAERGWAGLMVEGDRARARALAEGLRSLPSVAALHRWASCEPGAGLDDILAAAAVPDPFDLLSIDIDGNDYWVWRQARCRPKAVVIEYNCHFKGSVSVPYDPAFRWGRDDFYGASAGALAELAAHKGYALVHALGDTNLFFVLREHAGLFEPYRVEWAEGGRLHPAGPRTPIPVPATF